MAEEADAHGSRLLLEPQTRASTSLWNTPDEALAVLDSLGTPAGLVLDTHHLEAEGVEPIRAITEHASVTSCLQLAAHSTRGPSRSATTGSPRCCARAASPGG
ncbi:hypothetical protein ACF090_07850 [Streptomyces sp. NPDC014892]|uniref:hypothetical protein n=1 Tax=Streptomyces sp. NPDC014892 TaxID=3364930 RepID=UPI0036F93E5F